jgi:hypothetical protein
LPKQMSDSYVDTYPKNSALSSVRASTTTCFNARFILPMWHRLQEFSYQFEKYF